MAMLIRFTRHNIIGDARRKQPVIGLIPGMLALAATVSGAPCVSAQSLSPTHTGSARAETIDFEPFAAFPPGAELAMVVGEPSGPGPYVVRVKVPDGVKLMPHIHPEDRVYTVISGVFYIGFGNTFDAAKLKAYAPGSVIVLPHDTPHFHQALSGEYVTQVTGTGPLGIEYIDEQDDPRHGAPHTTTPAPSP
jgi:quercetin dioxygenase-like cupin family protein